MTARLRRDLATPPLKRERAKSSGVGLPTHRPPTSPGEMLREEFLVPLGITQSDLAKRMGVPVGRVNQILQQKRALTAGSSEVLCLAVNWPNGAAGAENAQQGGSATVSFDFDAPQQ